MNYQDKEILKMWLRTNATLTQVTSASSIGLVGNVRFSNDAVKWYKFIWEFSCHRLSSVAQDRIYNRYGLKALHRRFNRVNRIVTKLLRD
jgi:hypothetical protein